MFPFLSLLCFSRKVNSDLPLLFHPVNIRACLMLILLLRLHNNAAAAAAADRRIYVMIDDNWETLSIAILTFGGFHRNHSQRTIV